VSFTVVSWEVSTGDGVRAARITSAAQRALAPFHPAPLLVDSFILDSENQNVERIRQALDGVAASFPQEFFYTTADQPESDIQGVYPPFADLPGAHEITGDDRAPFPRGQTAARRERTARPSGLDASRAVAPLNRAAGRAGGQRKRAAAKPTHPTSGRRRSPATRLRTR